MTQAMERPGAQAPKVKGHHNPPEGKPKPWPVEFFSTAVGKKWIMAISGIALMGFVFAHMFGNLKMYLGPTDYNDYAHSLRTLLHPIFPDGFLLWLMRLGLIAMFLIHIGVTISLTRMNQTSRPVKYQSQRSYIAADFAARSMRWTGTIVFFYLIYHLADLTFGWANPDFVYGDAYGNVVASFDRWYIALFYIVANLLLGIHLYHGGWSMFQSLGVNSPRYNGIRRGFAITFAVIVTIANVSFPLAVQFGIVS